MAKSQSLRSIYQLKVTLNDSRPIIWRRLQILSTDTLEDLHLALQIVMGWTDEHLHEFVKGKQHYGMLDDHSPPELLDESEYRLAQVLKKEKDKLTYEYDFGDGWRHEVELEKILPYKTDTILPVCLKGARACPPEDVGGVYGYERLLKIIRNPKHPEYEDNLEWVGDDFDPKHFDLAETNDLLREYCDEPPEGTLPDMPDTENFSKDLFKPLSEEEFDYLDLFLLYRIDEDADVEDGEEGILDMSELDGFFTAIVSGPVVIHPSQWLPVLWGKVEPVWESEKEFQLILTLMMRHMNTIAGCLLEDPESFEPVFMQSNVVKTELMIVDEWCEGYLRGVALAAEQWNAAGQEMSILLTPIRAFTTESDWRGHDSKDEELLHLQKAIAPNVRDIHAYWLARRQEHAPASQQPVRSTEPRVGRNDPCPCGSGKKYKKCCLH